MTDLNVVEFGSGHAVLALHGAYSTQHEIAGVLRGVLPDHRIICPDLPGHGQSLAVSVDRAEQTVELLAELLRERVGDEPVMLVGHSLGAHLARGLAARPTIQVSSMLLLTPLVPSDIRPEPMQVVVDDGSSDSLPAELRGEFEGYFVVRTAETVAAFTKNVVPALNQFDPGCVEAQLGNSDLKLELTRDRAELPVVVAVGRRDSLIGWRQYEGLLAAYPRAHAVIVANAGHALPHESPETIRYALSLLA